MTELEQKDNLIKSLYEKISELKTAKTSNEDSINYYRSESYRKDLDIRKLQKRIDRLKHFYSKKRKAIHLLRFIALTVPAFPFYYLSAFYAQFSKAEMFFAFACIALIQGFLCTLMVDFNPDELKE